jgi:hypothetical protein
MIPSTDLQSWNNRGARALKRSIEVVGCAALGFLLLAPLCLEAEAEATSPLIDRCLKAMDSIKSYDAFIRIEQYAYPYASDLTKLDNAPVRVLTEENRDVFAAGLGRRIERNVGDTNLFQVGVIDWKTAASSGKPLAKTLSFVLPGLTYHDYLDPRAKNVFLGDLLRDKRSRITSLEVALPDAELPGFEVENPLINGPVRLWLDPRHGGMPKKVECYERSNDQFALKEKMQVEEFLQISGDIFVPAKATLTSVVPRGPAKGRAYLGFSMVIDPKQSSWNAVKSDSLFRAESLPEMNHHDKGWKYYYPVAMLPGIKAAAKEAMTTSESTSLILIVVVISMPLVGLLAFMARRKFVQLRSPNGPEQTQRAVRKV